MKKIAVTGSFDPITLGHMYVVEKALEIADEAVLLVLINDQKKYLFTLEERLLLCKRASEGNDRVKAAAYNGLAADYCNRNAIRDIMRGYRNRTELFYECEMAEYNEKTGGVRTHLISTDNYVKDISSSVVRENIMCDATLAEMVPQSIIKPMREILSDKRRYVNDSD